jgi:hypothetical protein
MFGHIRTVSFQDQQRAPWEHLQKKKKRRSETQRNRAKKNETKRNTRNTAKHSETQRNTKGDSEIDALSNSLICVAMKRNTYDRVWGSKHPVTLGTHGHTKQHGGFAEQRQRGKGSWVVGVVDVRRNEITDTVQIDDCGVGSGTNRSSRNKKQQETARIFPKRRTVRKPKTEKKNRQNFNTWAGVLGGSPPMNRPVTTYLLGKCLFWINASIKAVSTGGMESTGVSGEISWEA